MSKLESTIRITTNKKTIIYPIEKIKQLENEKNKKMKKQIENSLKFKQNTIN